MEFLKNTEIPTVKYTDLIPGNIYLIQHNDEGLVQNYNTRFRGRFVRRNPTGIKNLPDNLHVAVFDNVNIISKHKVHISKDVWIFLTNQTDGEIIAKNTEQYQHEYDQRNPNPETRMKRDIMFKNRELAFEVERWSFAESKSTTDLDTKMKENILGHLSHDGPNPNYTKEQQEFQIKQQKVFQEVGPGSDIAAYAGINIPKTKTATNGGKRRIRRIRRTRRGKSRKGRTIKQRRR
jgi:hypothetical protein